MATGSGSHAVMKSSLAKALIESGVQHYDLGGIIGDIATGGLAEIPNMLKGLTPSNSYQAQLAPTTQSNFAPTIDQAQTNALAVNPQQTQLAQALLSQSQGQGPNPAQAQLAQATGNNIAAQGAMMAGQRGSSSNAGLLARQIAQQGAATQQQAVGQGATLQAEQQLGAQRQLQDLYGQQQAGANQLLGTAASAQNSQNTGNIQNYGQQQGINSGVAQGNTNAQSQLIGGLLNGGAGAITAFAAKGGKVENSGAITPPDGKPQQLTDGGSVPGKPEYSGNDVRNDTELALLSKGEVVLPNEVTKSADPAKKAAEFMKHLKGDDDKPSYDKVAQSKKSLKKRIEELEMCMGGKI